MPEYYAHSRNATGHRQPLADHAVAVADQARVFAAPFHAGDLAYVAGLWHDIGKFHPAFQQYLRDAEADPAHVRHGPDHKAAGASLALERRLDPLMLVLQGHHGGLNDRTDLKRWYGERRAAAADAIQIAQSVMPDLSPAAPVSFPPFTATPLALEFFLRMLFSALVDADFLDTEAHFTPADAATRHHAIPMAELWARFAAKHALYPLPDTTLAQARADIYAACIDAANDPPGIFRLSVPTGGGKTLSGMAFALRHALQHGLQRVIVAIPYLTITQQTAQVYRAIFDNDADSAPCVLEHHSAAGDASSDSDEYDATTQWRRLSAQNWNAPIVVTTTVQLFESLFANSTSRCRKLHSLTQSVIILDEAQSLPRHLLDPILDGLQELVTNYSATVVLSTATQPAWEAVPIFNRVQARDIVPDFAQYFRLLKRVTYDWRHEIPVSWSTVADWLRAEPQALCIVNTKRSALDLLDALADPAALHLSTLLCGAHRTAVLAEVKRRLAHGLPCRLVSTQVVEAGVDLDFPVVYRALAPLDSIVQAAGRANREGRLASGRVVIFQPQTSALPGPEYRRAVDITRKVRNMGFTDLDDPATTFRYFSELFPVEDTDTRRIQPSRRSLLYPQVAHDFRMIDDETTNVLVVYGTPDVQAQVEQLWEQLDQRVGNPRTILRKLQPWIVSLFTRQARNYQKDGWIQPSQSIPEFGLWLGRYDPVRGIAPEDPQPDALIV